ncbi:MAG: hypothetical protein ACRBB2_01930 [Nitrosopumilus sp.]
MHHEFYFDGNKDSISWAIQTEDSIVKENRKHAEIYRDKITNLQSKYVALHVGLFWGIGVSIIKNRDSLKVMCDEKIIHHNITTISKIEDDFIAKKIGFIKQLIIQRELKTEFEVISYKKNLST